jgi:glycosyltransferase involved in cell wall biosynthesis
MTILAIPRDENPYQGLLYAELERRGESVRYVGELTRSQTLNLLLLPFELAWRRVRGARVLHVHWVFKFGLPHAARLPLLRRLAQGWFGLVLGAARLVGLRVAWTAHNALPHERVFHDDEAARRALVRSADVVFVHSASAVDALAAFGARPRAVTQIPLGPFHAPEDVALMAPPSRARDEPLRILFFGKVLEYKGAEDLLAAAAALPGVHVTIAGECSDARLAERLRALAGPNVRLLLRHVPDADVAALFGAADVVALPFRGVTTTSSVVFAQAHSRPVVIPDLPALSDLPADSVLRYDGSVDGLRALLADIAAWDSSRLAAAGTAARAHADSRSWSEAAERTLEALA